MILGNNKDIKDLGLDAGIRTVVLLGIGVLVGSLITGAGAFLLWENAVKEISKGEYANSPLFTQTAHQIYDQIISQEQKRITTNIIGTVTDNANGKLTITATRSNEAPQTFIFNYNDSTEFFITANDEQMTKTPVNGENISVGARVSIETKEAISSVANQHATRVIQF